MAGIYTTPNMPINSTYSINGIGGWNVRTLYNYYGTFPSLPDEDYISWGKNTSYGGNWTSYNDTSPESYIPKYVNGSNKVNIFEYINYLTNGGVGVANPSNGAIYTISKGDWVFRGEKPAIDGLPGDPIVYTNFFQTGKRINVKMALYAAWYIYATPAAPNGSYTVYTPALTIDVGLISPSGVLINMATINGGLRATYPAFGFVYVLSSNTSRTLFKCPIFIDFDIIFTRGFDTDTKLYGVCTGTVLTNTSEEAQYEFKLPGNQVNMIYKDTAGNRGLGSGFVQIGDINTEYKLSVSLSDTSQLSTLDVGNIIITEYE